MKLRHYISRKGDGAINAPQMQQLYGLLVRYRREAECIRAWIAWLEESSDDGLRIADARTDLLWCERAVQRLERATCWDDLATGR